MSRLWRSRRLPHFGTGPRFIDRRSRTHRLTSPSIASSWKRRSAASASVRSSMWVLADLDAWKGNKSAATLDPAGPIGHTLVMISPSSLTKIAIKLRTQLALLVYRGLYRPTQARSDLIRLGTSYGGWWVPSALLNEHSVCYSGGVGTDISFDLGLINQFACEVWGFDPTPASIAWVKSLNPGGRFHHVPIGLGGECRVERFYAPRDNAHVSHSVVNLQKTDKFFEAEVKTIGQVMADLGHSAIDLLKLDIEGAEHETIEAMLMNTIRPAVLCIELDQPEPFRSGMRTVGRIRAAGYDLVKLDGLNLTFVRC
jgi:FkbM family methyltransferase